MQPACIRSKMPTNAVYGCSCINKQQTWPATFHGSACPSMNFHIVNCSANCQLVYCPTFWNVFYFKLFNTRYELHRYAVSDERIFNLEGCGRNWSWLFSKSTNVCKSRVSAVGVAIWLRGRSSSPGRGKILVLSTSSRPVLGSTQPPIQWVPGALPRG
jgi:hypothetical protein